MKHLTAILIALALLAPGARATDLGPVGVHATFSQGYMNSDNNNLIDGSEDGTFDLREYGVNAVWKTPVDKLQLGAQVFAREAGRAGNDQVYLDWACADYRIRSALGVRLGRVRMPYGFYNGTRDIDALRTEIILPLAVYPEFARETVDSLDGGSLYGTFDLDEAGTIAYELAAGMVTLDVENGDMNRVLQGLYYFPDSYDEEAAYAAGVVWNTPVRGLRTGVTYTWLEFDSAGTYAPVELGVVLPVTSPGMVLDLLVSSVEYTVGDLVLTLEAVDAGADLDMETPAGPAAYDADFEGWYARATYRFCDWFEAATGYGDIDEDAGTFREYQTDFFISARFNAGPNVIFKLEQHFIDGSFSMTAQENPDGIEGRTPTFVAKATVFF